MKVVGHASTLPQMPQPSMAAAQPAPREIGVAAFTMQITIEERGMPVRERLRKRLEDAALLRCTEHDEPVTAVSIHAHESGWFDSMWITCCAALERQAATILKARC
jgi:hypothetical protein